MGRLHSTHVIRSVICAASQISHPPIELSALQNRATSRRCVSSSAPASSCIDLTSKHLRSGLNGTSYGLLPAGRRSPRNVVGATCRLERITERFAPSSFPLPFSTQGVLTNNCCLSFHLLSLFVSLRGFTKLTNTAVLMPELNNENVSRATT